MSNGRDWRGLVAGLALSALLALLAYFTNVVGSSPFEGGDSLPVSVTASAAWLLCCGWLIQRYRWPGALSLIGAPAALEFPLFFAFAHDTLQYGCAIHNICP